MSALEHGSLARPHLAWAVTDGSRTIKYRTDFLKAKIIKQEFHLVLSDNVDPIIVYFLSRGSRCSTSLVGSRSNTRVCVSA